MTLGRAVGLRPQRPTERRLFLRVGALESGMRIMLVVGVAENERPYNNFYCGLQTMQATEEFGKIVRQQIKFDPETV